MLTKFRVQMVNTITPRVSIKYLWQNDIGLSLAVLVLEQHNALVNKHLLYHKCCRLEFQTQLSWRSLLGWLHSQLQAFTEDTICGCFFMEDTICTCFFMEDIICACFFMEDTTCTCFYKMSAETICSWPTGVQGLGCFLLPGDHLRSQKSSVFHSPKHFTA